MNFTHRQILSVLWGVLPCILLAAIDQTVVIPAVPAIAADLHGFSHLSWIVSAYLLTSTAATPIYGRLSDLRGRRAMLRPALVLFILASACCALAQTLPQLIAARALQGLGGGGLMALAQAAIADVVSPRERGRYQVWMASTWGIASIGGPVLGGWLADALSWRWIFWINLPIGVAAFVLGSRALALLPARRVEARIDYIGALLLTGCIVCALGVLGSAIPGGAVPLGVFGLILLAGLIRQEGRAPDPLLPPRIFAIRALTGGIVIATLNSAVLFAAIFLLPLAFQLALGESGSAAGLLIVPFLGATIIGAYISGQVSRRTGRLRPPLLAGIGLCAAGFALLALTGPEVGRSWMVVLTAPAGLGLGASLPATLVMVQNAAERRDVGVATAALLFLRSIGGAFGSTLVGAVVTSRFASRLAELGAGSVDLGALRGTGSLPPAILIQARDALSGGFRLAFLACAGLGVAAFLLTMLTPDPPLRE